MTIKQQLLSELKIVLEELGIQGIASVLEIPSDSLHGDYSTNAAFSVSKALQTNPMEAAAQIKAKFDNRESGIVEKVDVLKQGFVNFWLSKDYLLAEVEKYADAPQKNFVQSGHGKVAIVEYSSPNIAKPFTVGHLRSTIIGDAIANILSVTGWQVHRDNHIGDWGTQFGKQIYAIKTWGNEEEIERSDEPVKMLVELYVKFHDEAEKNPSLEDEARAWFKKLEEGDVEAKRLWKQCIDWSWREFDGIYKQLGVAFTENGGHGYGESFFEDKMAGVVRELEEKGLLKEGEEGAKLVFFPNDSSTDSSLREDFKGKEGQGKYPPLMILKKDGTTLYATRDLATDKFRLEKYGSEILVINEVGGEQALYFKQLYEVERMLGWYEEGQRIHIKHGLYRFKDQKMSTRKGNTIWLEDVLKEAKNKAEALAKSSENSDNSENQTAGNSDNQTFKRSESSDLAVIVGIGALKWNDLKRSPEQDIVFEWDDILNMQGNSGPYMQYAYARTQSILRKFKTLNSKSETNTKYEITKVPAGLNTKYQLNPEERELAKQIVRFGDAVADAGGRFAPHIVATYLFELAQSFSLFYQKHQILKAEEDVRDFRLFLTKATGEILKEGLSLLGIQAPQNM